MKPTMNADTRRRVDAFPYAEGVPHHSRGLPRIDGRRRGLRLPWLCFVVSLFTSFGFAMGIYLAAQERQLRWNAAHARATAPQAPATL
jgi:hypothetical protein